VRVRTSEGTLSDPNRTRGGTGDPTPTDSTDRTGWRDRLRRHSVLDPVYRTGVAIVGLGVVAIGLLLVPFPGPGWLVVFVGLGILATEFAWAKRLLNFAKAKVRGWTEWLSRQSALFRLLALLATALVVIALALAYVVWLGMPEWIPLRL
jgi:TIGR02611 family protein